MDVSCDKAEVGIRKRKGGGHSINKIDLYGNVNLSSGLKAATCGKAEIFPEDEAAQRYQRMRERQQKGRRKY